jgi:hypothetical protein
MVEVDPKMAGNEDGVHNNIDGQVFGPVFQARDMHFHQAGQAKSVPPMSEYMTSLVRSVEEAWKKADGKQLVVTGKDAVVAVRCWAEVVGRNYYKGRTVEVDLGRSSWRDRVTILPHHELVLLVNARDLASVRAFRDMGPRQKEILAVVATEHRLAEADDVRILSTPEGKARRHSFPLLPSSLFYDLYPAGIALAAGLVITVVVLIICTDNALPGWAVIVLGMLAAVIATPAGYGSGRVIRAIVPLTRGRLHIGPGGIEMQKSTGLLQLHWPDIEYLAVTPMRTGIDVLLVKAPLKNQEPYPVNARDLGVVGLCLLGIPGRHCDLPAMAQTRDDILAAVTHYTLTPVVRTREELFARESGLRDRI